MNYSLFIFILTIATIIFVVIKFSTTYTISISDFKNLFNGMNDERLIDVTIFGHNHVSFKIKIYPIDKIQCFDKKGNYVVLKNNPGIEIQFLDFKNKKTSMYFDTIRIHDNFITGHQSRYFSSFKKTVDLNEVKEIELRNIKKGFKYINDPFK